MTSGTVTPPTAPAGPVRNVASRSFRQSGVWATESVTLADGPSVRSELAVVDQ